MIDSYQKLFDSWPMKLSSDDQRELEYAERAVRFLTEQRKAVNKELATERAIIRSLMKKQNDQWKTHLK